MPRIAGIDKSGHLIGSFAEIAYDQALPAGTLLCDGSAISRTTYAGLFAAIGIKWGSGDGTTTFNLPDLRGKFLRGRDHGAGHDPDAAGRAVNSTGGATGDAVGSVQGDGFASHAHDTQGNTGGFATGAAFVAFNLPGTSVDGSGVVMAAGGNETRPKNAYANFVVAYL